MSRQRWRPLFLCKNFLKNLRSALLRPIEAANFGPLGRCSERRRGCRLKGSTFHIDLAQRSLLVLADRQDVKPPEEPRLPKDEPPSKPTSSNEAVRIIEEYAKALREILKKLRGRLN